MAGGPRKFSEKIALLNQKEAEANAAFHSIMGEVARAIKTNNTGSQSDMIHLNENNTNTINSKIEESMNFSEQISVTYDNQINSFSSQFQNHQKPKKHEGSKKTDNGSTLLTNNSFLQLPNQTDPFRRALSDSSLHQTVANTASSNPNSNLIGLNNIQMNYNQNFSQNNQNLHSFNLNHLQFNSNNSQLYQANTNYQNNNGFQSSYGNIGDYNNLSSPVSPLPISTNLSLNNQSNNTVQSTLPQNNLAQLQSKVFKKEPTIPSNDSNQSRTFPTGYNPHLSSSTAPNAASPLQSPTNYNDFSFMSSNSVPYLQNSNNLKYDALLSPNSSFLNPNIGNSTGGSLPDLTAFQFQTNQLHQNLQINEYNQRQKNIYDLQLLQPNIHQHNHIGPVKPTHNGSVSPTRGMSRYNPTFSSSNANNINNRRPSPQRNLPQGINSQSKTNLSSQSTPTSPLQPPSQGLPVLEFTVNTQQVNNYMTGINLVNSNIILNSNKNSNQNNGLYRNVPVNTGANCESLPPSPQSQQSCFNSPQGSPGPISISPQDLNPFSTSTTNTTNNATSNNSYDIMQKKFDSIDLGSNPLIFNQYILNNSNGVLNNQLSKIPQNKCRNDNDDGNKLEGEIGANNQSVLSSRNGSLSSSGSGNNMINNSNIFDDIQNLNSNYQQNSHSANISNKNHKNSIPNIILTCPTDSIDDKNDILINLNPRDISTEINFDGQFDLDIQIDDPNSINFSEPNIFQNS
ncbi:unnamed protein product [Brachionus calyciflorus]|uniref:Transducer of regulated CREB activity N-terminal domain-containing protein n=1 Tax=Brachionus calyciflorus TaxID=104777 RepID=A0A813W0Y2_9BILA|nr:unnamed protein product [Brachionus calyciflorus]